MFFMLFVLRSFFFLYSPYDIVIIIIITIIIITVVCETS